MERDQKIIIYTDGGSRGNPGPAALGVVFKDSKGNTLKEYGETLGNRTNNEAEYEAVIFALKKAKQLHGKEKVKKMEFEIRMDSDLVCNQVNGVFKIENEKLIPLFIAIWNLKLDFGPLTFKHVRREHNREADAMVNEALDGQTQGSML